MAGYSGLEEEQEQPYCDNIPHVLRWHVLTPGVSPLRGRWLATVTGEEVLTIGTTQESNEEQQRRKHSHDRDLHSGERPSNVTESPFLWAHRHFFFLFSSSKKFLWCETAHKLFFPDPVLMLITCVSVTNNQKEVVQQTELTEHDLFFFYGNEVEQNLSTSFLNY